MRRRLGIGIIGAGMIANSHAKIYSQIKGVKVIAVADIDEGKAKAFAKEHKVKYTFRDWRDLLSMDEVDAVSICLPVYLHAPATVDSLRAGKHVLCEKPMARNASEAEEMVEEAKRSGKKLMVYYRSRFSPEARRAKEVIDSGELGRIYFVRCIGHRWRGRPGFDEGMKAFGSWFMKKELAGGGTMMDLGGYSIDLVLGLLGFPEVDSVSCSMYQEIDKEKAIAAGVDVEELAVGYIRLRDGGAIWIESSFAVNVPDPGGVFFFGSKAGMRLSPLTIYKDRDGKPEEVLVDIPKDRKAAGYWNPQEHFVDCILQDKPIQISSGEEALVVTRIQEAMYRSAELGGEVRL
jgi:predicted dehydrogenase